MAEEKLWDRNTVALRLIAPRNKSQIKGLARQKKYGTMEGVINIKEIALVEKIRVWLEKNWLWILGAIGGLVAVQYYFGILDAIFTEDLTMLERVLVILAMSVLISIYALRLKNLAQRKTTWFEKIINTLKKIISR